VDEALTPRERVRLALAFEETDLVPYHLMIDERVRPALADYLGDPAFERAIDNHLPFYQLEPTVEWLTADTYADAFGSVWRRGVFPHLERWPLVDPSLRGYTFPNLLEPDYFSGVGDFLARHRRHFTFCGLVYGYFDRGWALRGMENFLTDFVTAPAFVTELFEWLTAAHLELIDHIAGLGFDGIRFGDDWGYQRGILIGARRWRQMVKPGLAQIFGRARDHGLTVMVHSDGDVTELIPDLIEMGVQILNPVQPEAMDQLAIKRRYGRVLCLNGGVSTQQTLPRSTPAEVRREVQACLHLLGQDGGYILSPAKAILPDVPLANAAALIEAMTQQPQLRGRRSSSPPPEMEAALRGVYTRFHQPGDGWTASSPIH
jgi:uroporphyrinogen decarboxylase